MQISVKKIKKKNEREKNYNNKFLFLFFNKKKKYIIKWNEIKEEKAKQRKYLA